MGALLGCCGASPASCCDATGERRLRLFARLRSDGEARLNEDARGGVVSYVDDEEREDDGSIGDRLDEEDDVFSNANVLDLVLAETDEGSTGRCKGGMYVRLREGGSWAGVFDGCACAAALSLPSPRSRRVE